ncbi:MAG: hypothetical protein CMH56_01375 [Myxococcales bacterium]|nr:hypothetical protein [Myxococcales bacterium]|tara:strand:- start:472 stop:1347 length:876 start_codon:yes stop_codon:yes gene_type:complete
MTKDKFPKDKKHKADRHNARGIQLADRGWLDEATLEFEKAIESDPNAAHAMDNLGTVYAEKGLLLEALQAYIKSIEIDDDPKESYFNLAAFLLHHSRNLSLDLLKQVAQKDWHFPDVHGQIGYTMGELGRPSEAMEAYKMAIEHDPNDMPSRQELAGLYMTFGQFMDAIQELKTVLAQKPDTMEAWIDLGVCYHMKGLLCEAKKSLQKGIDLEPENPHALFRMAALLADEGRDTESLDVIHRIYLNHGESVRVWAENDPVFHRFKKDPRWLNIFLNLEPQQGKELNENQEA